MFSPARPTSPSQVPAPPLLPWARLRQPIVVLALGTVFSGGLILIRIHRTHSTALTGFFGNLLLAWIPLTLSLLIYWALRREDRWRRVTGPAWALWILFYPNSFYIVTDLIHFQRFGSEGVEKWYDILMFSSFSYGGVFLGCLSLYLMHLLVRRSFGTRAGWAFATALQALGAIGIFVGRFWRLNSWDVLRPWRLWR